MPAGVFKETYRGLMAHLRYPIHVYSTAAALALLLALPFIAGSFIVDKLVLYMAFLVAAIGLNITTGLAGQISLAQAALMGAGAFTAAWLTLHGVNILLAIPAGALVAAAVGTVLGLPSFRLKGYYLAMASIAAQELLYYIYQRWVASNQYMPVNDSAKTLLGVYLGGGKPLYYTALLITIAAAWAAANIGRSSLGRAMKAVRDNDISAEIIGINVAKTKAIAFALGSFYAGLAGGLLALQLVAIDYGNFSLEQSINLLAMVLVGGAGRVIWGSVLGLIAIMATHSILEMVFQGNPVYDYLVLGAIIAFFVVEEPEGLIAVLRRVKEYFRLWPYSY
ncbi:branched-chain amino acid ABC transporter permease [Pyrodictium occultum]|uniref:branched-chain amino acid ABC transporter permease n=1 Tax=Pyrodictium occultum TaxID=2309 RepID=UPI0014434589|nr:branched-chain amino acid ABC transporter permease [Pyrodictium occultum]